MEMVAGRGSDVFLFLTSRAPTLEIKYRAYASCVKAV